MPLILDKNLYEQVKKEADEKYKKSSAYKSGWIVKTYKDRGGKYADDGKTKNLKRWFKEEWIDVGKKSYPVYRPTKRISAKTPLTIDEIDPKQLKSQIKIKQYIKGMENLPKFKKKKGGKLRASEVRNLLDASYQGEPPENIGDWILDNGLSNEYGKVYYKPDGSAVVAHRGTSGALDWGNNLAYALGQYENTDRYRQGKAIQEKAESKYGAKNISTLGHSQGSVLSRKLGANTKEIINVNPAYKGEVPLKNEYNIRSSKDVVSSAYAPVSKISKLLYPSYTDKHSITIPTDKSFDVLGNHSYDILTKLGDKDIGEGAGIVKPNYPDWEDLKWGSFTKQFQRYKQTHPSSSISNLEEFAKSILRNPNDYHPKTLKRARFYLNVILKKKGGGMSSESSSEDECEYPNCRY